MLKKIVLGSFFCLSLTFSSHVYSQQAEHFSTQKIIELYKAINELPAAEKAVLEQAGIDFLEQLAEKEKAQGGIYEMWEFFGPYIKAGGVALGVSTTVFLGLAGIGTCALCYTGYRFCKYMNGLHQSNNLEKFKALDKDE